MYAPRGVEPRTPNGSNLRKRPLVSYKTNNTKPFHVTYKRQKLGSYTVGVPPDPIPNSEVKSCKAHDSRTLPAKVGSCQISGVFMLVAYTTDMPRHLKRILILAIYALIIGGIGFGIRSFNTVTPTCTDGVQNGSEDGVDCGVACGKLCDPVIEPLTVAPALLVPADGGYDILASFENTNSIYGAERIEYDIAITSSDGVFSQKISGVAYGLPQQTFFVAHHLDSAPQANVSATVTVQEVIWRKVRPQEVGIDIQVQDESLVLNPRPGVVVEARGVVRNASPYQLDRVDVAVLLYDATEALVGAGSTNLRTLSSGSERLFTVSWRGPLVRPPVRVRTFLSTNALANDAFLETYDTSPERFQIPY